MRMEIFTFQLSIEKKEKLFRILTGGGRAQSSAVGHLGMTSRKYGATQSSNVNEFMSVYFLVQPMMSPRL